MDKINVTVVYHSIQGTTAQLAEGIVSGVDNSELAEGELFSICGEDIHHGRFTNNEMLERISSADAIVFGSPTFMGTVSAQFKAFADATTNIWSVQGWHNKIAGGFTTGANFSGDQLHTIQYLQILSAQHSMIWLGVDIPGVDATGVDAKSLNRLGAQSGLITCTENDQITESDVMTAQAYGERIACFVKRLS